MKLIKGGNYYNKIDISKGGKMKEQKKKWYHFWKSTNQTNNIKLENGDDENMQANFKNPMNVVAKDTVSGFQGIIIARNAHLFGCAQYGLAPQELGSDGKPKQTEYFDEARIEILDDTNAVHGDNEYSKIFAIPMGTEVKDKVSNFQGKILTVVEYLHNCNTYYVEPPVDKDGKPQDGRWFDEGRLETVGKGITPEEVAAPKRGSVFSRDIPTR